MDEIALHILDLAQNSVAAGASHLTVEVEEDAVADRLNVRVADDGCGMDGDMAARAQDPFTTTRTTRKVGLGIPLCKAGCLACGGSFELTSAPGVGTEIRCFWQMSHIDRPPLGDMAGTLFTLLALNPALELRYRHSAGGCAFLFDTLEIRATLMGLPLDNPEVLGWLRQYLIEGEQVFSGGDRSQ